MRKFNLILALLIVGYGVWPYWSLYQLKQAFNDGNVTAIDRKVDWSSLRQSLKGFIISEMNSKPSKDNFAAGLTATLGPMFVDKMVDAYVSPAGLAKFLKRDEKREISLTWANVQRARFSNPTRFEVTIVDLGEPPKPVTFVFRFQNFGWELVKAIPRYV